MKRLLFCLALITSLQAWGAGFLINLSNGDFDLVGEVSEPKLVEFGAADELDFVQVEITGMFAVYQGERHRLAAEFGWGDVPLGLVCEQVGEQIGVPGLRYAETYGFVESYGLLSFSRPDVLVVQEDGSLRTEKAGSTYNTGMTCSTRDMEY